MEIDKSLVEDSGRLLRLGPTKVRYPLRCLGACNFGHYLRVLRLKVIYDVMNIDVYDYDLWDMEFGV